MKSILMMLTLLATATAVGAQTPPVSPPTELPSPYYVPFTPAYVEPAQTPAQPASECPFAKALQDANVAWQRLLAMCGGAKTSCGMSNACKGAGCGTGVAGCCKGSEAAQPPKTCCCAKACACCETCKAAKARETVQVEQVPMPMVCPFAMPPMGCWKMQCGSGSVQIVAQPVPAPPMGPYPMPMPMMGPALPHAVFMAANLGLGNMSGARPAKLVTPDFEAHCDHMIQKGDTIQLVGNVMLLCKKYAQPLRIEGQRIVLNLNDGSFVVEAGPALPRVSAPAVGVGMLRIESMQIQRLGAGASAPRTEPMPERVEKVIRLRHAQAVDVANALSEYIRNCRRRSATPGVRRLQTPRRKPTPDPDHRRRADHQFGDRQHHASRTRQGHKGDRPARQERRARDGIGPPGERRHRGGAGAARVASSLEMKGSEPRGLSPWHGIPRVILGHGDKPRGSLEPIIVFRGDFPRSRRGFSYFTNWKMPRFVTVVVRKYTSPCSSSPNDKIGTLGSGIGRLATTRFLASSYLRPQILVLT